MNKPDIWVHYSIMGSFLEHPHYVKDDYRQDSIPNFDRPPLIMPHIHDIVMENLWWLFL